jgi:hypothetical protein
MAKDGNTYPLTLTGQNITRITGQTRKDVGSK